MQTNSNIKLSQSINGYSQAIYNYSTYNHDMPSNVHATDVNIHHVAFNELKNEEYISIDTINQLSYSNLKFWVTVINETPYNKPDYVLVELTLMYLNKPLTFYAPKQWLISLFQAEQPTELQQAEPTLYHYEMLYRPLSPFCQPKNHLAYDATKGRHGVITYDRRLTCDELDEYELREWIA